MVPFDDNLSTNSTLNSQRSSARLINQVHIDLFDSPRDKQLDTDFTLDSTPLIASNTLSVLDVNSPDFLSGDAAGKDDSVSMPDLATYNAATRESQPAIDFELSSTLLGGSYVALTEMPSADVAITHNNIPPVSGRVCCRFSDVIYNGSVILGCSTFINYYNNNTFRFVLTC